MDIKTAGIAAMYSVPSSLSDRRRHGSSLWPTGRLDLPRFLVCTLIVSYPQPTSGIWHDPRSIVHVEMGIGGFIVTVFVLGFFMSLSRRPSTKHPVYYPKNVGAVGGLVGMIGGLGGFLPIVFGLLND